MQDGILALLLGRLMGIDLVTDGLRLLQYVDLTTPDRIIGLVLLCLITGAGTGKQR